MKDTYEWIYPIWNKRWILGKIFVLIGGILLIIPFIVLIAKFTELMLFNLISIKLPLIFKYPIPSLIYGLFIGYIGKLLGGFK